MTAARPPQPLSAPCIPGDGVRTGPAAAGTQATPCARMVGCGSDGPVRPGSAAPKSATTFVPTAVAMCSGPVSPLTTTAHELSTAPSCRSVVEPARETGLLRDARRSRPPEHGRRAADDDRPGLVPSATRSASSAKRRRGQRLTACVAPGFRATSGCPERHDGQELRAKSPASLPDGTRARSLRREGEGASVSR